MKMKLFKHILSIFAILACGAAFAQQDVPGGATSIAEGDNLGAGVASSQQGGSDMNVEAATDKDAKPIEINATDNHGIVHLAVKVNMDKASEITDDMIIQHLTTALRGIGHSGDLSPFYHSAIAAVKTAVNNVAEGGTVSGTVDLTLNIPNTKSGHAFPDNTIVASGS